MKLRAVGQCVPKCNFEIKQIPHLNSLNLDRGTCGNTSKFH